MKYSELFGKTTREVSKEEVSKNAQLLTRGGFVDKLQAGVYSFLPLGLRVLQKIEQVIREEMNKARGQEVLMPALHPKANWEKTGRWEGLDVLFRFESWYTKNDYALGATHEEVVTPLAKKFVKSYRDLPFAVYQFQTKFRDEKRAKSGILRGREFRMKDLYSFHASEKDLDKYYDEMIEVYVKVFERLGLGEMTFKTFASGGTFSKFSHEFQTVCEAGEDTIFLCEKCKAGHNKEVFEDGLVPKGQCVECGNKDLKEVSACEVGNIFKLKNKFASAFGLTFTDEDGKEKEVQMGCYGIGPSRVMGVITEVWNDEKGILWPESVSPFGVHILALDGKVKEAEKLEKELEKLGVEVLIDDRDERAGVKFADCDLIGIPLRVVISEKNGEKLEVKKRNEEESKMMSQAEFLKSFEKK